MPQMIPLWLRGRNVVAVTLQGLSLDNSGNFVAAGSPYSFTGFLDGVELASNPAQENISGMDSTQANYLILEDDTSFTVHEILRVPYTNLSTEGCYLANFANNYNI